MLYFIKKLCQIPLQFCVLQDSYLHLILRQIEIQSAKKLMKPNALQFLLDALQESLEEVPPQQAA